MMLVCMMGTFVMTGDNGLNVTNCLFYAVMAIISAIFDLMACVMYFSHSKYGLYEKKAPTMVLVAQTIFVASPIVLFVSGCLAYSMYRDCRNAIIGYDDYERPDYGSRDYRSNYGSSNVGGGERL